MKISLKSFLLSHKNIHILVIVFIKLQNAKISTKTIPSAFQVDANTVPSHLNKLDYIISISSSKFEFRIVSGETRNNIQFKLNLASFNAYNTAGVRHLSHTDVWFGSSLLNWIVAWKQALGSSH